jgi:hypothetical protein
MIRTGASAALHATEQNKPLYSQKHDAYALAATNRRGREGRQEFSSWPPTEQRARLRRGVLPIEEVPGTALRYPLIAFDEVGREQGDHPAGRMSEVTAAALAGEPDTDVFIFSHGWMADLPAARRQYAKWVTAMAQSRADIDAPAELHPGFRPLLGGGVRCGSFDPSASGRLVDEYAATIADTPAARDALRTILADPDPAVLPPEVADAYAVLDYEADREPFDPDRIMRNARGEGHPLRLAGRRGDGGNLAGGGPVRSGSRSRDP